MVLPISVLSLVTNALVLGVLAVMQGSLDLPYLRDWSQRLELSDLLERAFEEAQT